MLQQLIGPVSGLLDKFIEDKDQKAKLAHEIGTMAEKHGQEIALAQIALNTADAKGNFFQSSWRPLCGHVCVLGLAVNFLISPIAAGFGVEVPQADMSVMMPVLMGMLGLGGLRSQRSRDRLEGVDVGLIAVVDHAIAVTKVDFGVICGLRTIEEQRELVAKGASKTMKSKHIGGHAVDLMAYIGARGSWELNLYDDLADAMKEGAKAAGIGVRWGAAWHIPDIREWDGTMEEAMNAYVDLRRSQGKRPFIDGPHFELVV